MIPTDFLLYIAQLYYRNRANRGHFPQSIPFDIHLTNVAKSTKTVHFLPRYIHRMDQLSLHSSSYLDLPELFPRSRLVYLSPHNEFLATEALEHYSHDDIYIVGGLNDVLTPKWGEWDITKALFLKAYREELRFARLPLNEKLWLKWGTDPQIYTKSLHTNQVVGILREVSVTGDWRKATEKYIPPWARAKGDEVRYLRETFPGKDEINN